MLVGLWWLLDADRYTDELAWPMFSAGMQDTIYTAKRKTVRPTQRGDRKREREWDRHNSLRDLMYRVPSTCLDKECLLYLSVYVCVGYV